MSRENRELKEKLEKAGQETNEMAQELADLREIVFNQQTKGIEEKQEETKIRFPYRTPRRLIAFGGHDSFLREIKFKLPEELIKKYTKRFWVPEAFVSMFGRLNIIQMDDGSSPD